MFDGRQLLGFLTAVLVLVLVPGPNTFLILTQTIAGGRATGLATVAGVEAGNAIHMAAACLGLSTVLATSVLAFELVRYAGVAYLVLLGVQALGGGRHSPGCETPSRIGLARAFRRALIANVVNPKVALFFLALLPQFVRPERGQVFLQVLVLGVVMSTVSASFGTLLTLAAGRVSGWLRHQAFAHWEGLVSGCVFLALAAMMALAERH